MYFGHKHAETGPNCLHKSPSILKYDFYIFITYVKILDLCKILHLSS